jgi:hypothetical protein
MCPVLLASSIAGRLQLPGVEVLMLISRNHFENPVSVQRFVGAVAAFIATAVFGTTMLCAQSATCQKDKDFPDTTQLMAQVVDDQKNVESLFTQYTFTDTSTVYTLDKRGNVHSQHTDTYYVTPTTYEIFTLHMAHDGKPVAQANLEKQEKKIEQQIKDDERKSQKDEVIHPKNRILFADIIARSEFKPICWDQVDGLETVVYSFEPKSASHLRGSLSEKIASDLKGKMWVSPEEKEVLRIEFSSVSQLNLGLLGNVKGFQGVAVQQKLNGELWRPTKQEFVADGREFFSGFRIRQVDEFTDYLKATTDVFQQVHTSPASLEKQAKD